jgi:hypothetical protein
MAVKDVSKLASNLPFSSPPFLPKTVIKLRSIFLKMNVALFEL